MEPTENNENLENSSTSATTSHSASNESEAKSKKKVGTIDWGRPYEERISAHIAIQLTLNNEVEDFELVNNMDDFGAFDDVVVKVKYRNEHKENELILIQLKHKSNLEIEDMSKIFEVKGEMFYLEKYQKSFEKIGTLFKKNPLPLFHELDKKNITYILFSNVKFTGNQIQTDNFLLDEENCSTIMKMINTEGNARPYKIKHKNQPTNKISAEFLSQCWVLPNQIHAQHLEDLVRKDLEDNIQPDKIKIILDGFAKWTRSEYTEPITKSSMVHLLMEHCFPQYPVLITPNVNVKNSDKLIEFIKENCYCPFIDESQLQVLEYSIVKYMEEYFNIQVNDNAWHNKVDYEMIYNEEEQNLLSKREIFSTSNTYNDLYYLIWQMKKLPMLIKFTGANTKCIQFFMEKFENYLKTKSLVLIYQESPPKINNADQLNKINNFNILSNVSLSLQGKTPMNLQVLINNDEEVLKTITPNVLLTLLAKPITIGEKFELVPYYIGRKIMLPILKESVFEKIDHLFILKDEGNVNIEEYVKEYKIYINNKDDVRFKYENKNILNSNLTVEDSLRLLNSVKMSKHFLIKKDYGYHLIKSCGSIKDLDDSYFITVNEQDIFKFTQSPINIINNAVGMGKTCLLKNIANNAAPEDWIIYLSLNEHVGKLDSFDYSTQDKEILEYLLDHCTKKNYFGIKQFMKTLFLERVKNGHLILLLDGYDEQIFKKISEFTGWALKHKAKILITTRPTKILELENKLGIISSEMKHFTEDDQIKFLELYYKEKRIKPKKIVEIKQKVIELNSKHLSSTLNGIPLQSELLAEVLKDTPDAELDKIDLDLVNLYEKFLKKKAQRKYKIFYKKVAMTLFFPKETLEELHFDLEELNERIYGFKKNCKKDFIISGFTDEDVPMFVHRTYAEFLTAQYLLEQEKTNEKWKNLQKELGKDDRYFLDRLINM